MADKLKQAITSIKAGEKATGKQLLMEVLEAEPENDKAWVWMSAVVETDDLRRECLEEALMYNPFNETAQRGLAKLKAGQPKSAANSDGRATSLDDDLELTTQESWTYKPPPQQPLPQPQEFSQSYEPSETATTYVIKELARYSRKENIATNLAATGMNYDEALKFVHEIEASKRREIEFRRLPLIAILCGTLTFMGGVWTMSIFWAIDEGGVPTIWSFIFGIPMFISGIAGLIVSVYKIMKN
jgi:hypothetical protein